MNETAALLRKSAAFLWRNPVVLLPVLVARVADFLTYWVSGLLKGPVLKLVAPKSVLGGVSGKVNGPVLLVAALFTLVPLLIEVWLLLYSMVVCARWSHAIREDNATATRTWWAPMGDLSRVTAISLGVGAITALVGLYLTLRGGVPAGWSYVVTWCFLMMASWFVLPSWLSLLARVEGVRLRQSAKLPAFAAVLIGLVGYALCVYWGSDIQLRLTNAHHIRGTVTPFLINLAAACLSAIPLGFSFVALSRYVADRPGWPLE